MSYWITSKSTKGLAVGQEAPENLMVSASFMIALLMQFIKYQKWSLVFPTVFNSRDSHIKKFPWHFFTDRTQLCTQELTLGGYWGTIWDAEVQTQVSYM